MSLHVQMDNYNMFCWFFLSWYALLKLFPALVFIINLLHIAQVTAEERVARNSHLNTLTTF